MTDAELLEATAKARGLSHRAPFAEWSKDHRGHSSIVNHTAAWATHGRTFSDLMEEVRRRGLEIPDCDCSPGEHDWEKGDSVISPRLNPENPS